MLFKSYMRLAGWTIICPGGLLMNLWILSDRESQGSLTMTERESMFFIYNINKKYIRYNGLP